MNNFIAINNEVCDPIKPLNTDAIATRCLNVLLSGGILNRKTLGEMGITVNNASLHSIVSILRTERFIPIKSDRLSDGTCNYYIKPHEILRHNNPDLRQQQHEEMKYLVEKKRQEKIIKDFLRLLHKLDEMPHLWHYLENFPLRLDELAKEINALLETRKGVS